MSYLLAVATIAAYGSMMFISYYSAINTTYSLRPEENRRLSLLVNILRPYHFTDSGELFCWNFIADNIPIFHLLSRKKKH
jgi:hypothetical protein